MEKVYTTKWKNVIIVWRMNKMAIFGMILVEEKYYEKLKKGQIKSNIIKQKEDYIKRLEMDLKLARERPDIFLRGRMYNNEICDELYQLSRICRRNK